MFGRKIMSFRYGAVKHQLVLIGKMGRGVKYLPKYQTLKVFKRVNTF